MYAYTPGVEIISGQVTEKTDKSITIQDIELELTHIEIPEKMYHMIRGIQVGVNVVIHHTESGPKTIATYL